MPRTTTETTMTDRAARAARNQERSLETFLAKKAEFDALLAELQQASEDHFGADPETVLWGEAAWLSDAIAKLMDIADQHFRRGEYAL
jgi:hemerythrin